MINTKPLSSSAEMVLHAMHLNADQEVSVRNCIHKYATPHTFEEVFPWLFYRITHALKHIFGKSDWQVAKKSIQDRPWRMVAPFLQESASSPQMKKYLKSRFDRIISDAASGLLSTCLMAHERKTEIDNEFRKRVSEVDIFKAVREPVLILIDECSREFARRSSLREG